MSQPGNVYMSLYRPVPERAHDMSNGGVFSIFALDRLQAGHWIRRDYSIMSHGIHVPTIHKYQGDGRSLSNNYRAVIQEYFGQVAASCLVPSWPALV